MKPRISMITLGVRDLAASIQFYEKGLGIPAGSTALHVAAWRARHDTVAALLERGARVDARDGRGATPLMWAIKACVDSYWMGRRSPASVEALLRAGASTDGVRYPSGYEAVDVLLGG